MNADELKAEVEDEFDRFRLEVIRG
jgi:hypothetical protein